MNGLQVNVVGSAQAVAQPQPTNAAPTPITASSFYWTCYDPISIHAAIIATGATYVDQKYYLRQCKTYGMIYNHSNEDVWIHTIKMYFRTRIDSADYANVNAILNQATSINAGVTWDAPLTTSNVAQKLLKFGKSKYRKVLAGKTIRFRIGRKWKSPKMIDNAREADPAYISNKGTMVYYCKVVPTIAGYSAAANGVPSQVGPQAFNVLSTAYSYVSLYQVGLNNPQAYFTEIPYTAYTFPEHVFHAEIPQVIDIS